MAGLLHMVQRTVLIACMACHQGPLYCTDYSTALPCLAVCAHNYMSHQGSLSHGSKQSVVFARIAVVCSGRCFAFTCDAYKQTRRLSPYSASYFSTPDHPHLREFFCERFNVKINIYERKTQFCIRGLHDSSSLRKFYASVTKDYLLTFGTVYFM